MSAELTPARRWFRLAEEDLVAAAVMDIDDLDILDPWVIDGRYAADLPDLDSIEARQLLAAAQHVVDEVRHLVS